MESRVVCLVGAKAICRAVGQNPKNIVWLKKELGLPAFKVDGRGSWLARVEDLTDWTARMRARSDDNSFQSTPGSGDKS